MLTFNDPNLNAAFQGYRITEFTKDFPAAATSLSDPIAQRLNRVYRVQLNGSYQNIYNSIASAASLDLANFYLVAPVMLLHTPNDYINCFATCNGYPGLPMAKHHLNLVNARTAWDVTRGLDCIKVGIIDDGFLQHTDLANKITLGNNVVLQPANSGGSRHGTQVAAMAGAETDNGATPVPSYSGNIASLGNKVKLRYYNLYPILNVYNEIINAKNDGCKVINCSWYTGINNTGLPINVNEQDVIDLVTKEGVTVVAAAGNGAGGNSSAFYFPASYNNVISVTSVGSHHPTGTYFPDPGIPGGVAANWWDCHRQFLNPADARYNTMHQHNSKVDICAPGYYVETLGRDNYTDYEGGTSLASPQVAAAAALLYSLNPNFTPAQIEAFLKTSAYDIYPIHDNNTWAGLLGAGRLDAGAALQLAANSACLPKFTDIIWEGQHIRTGFYGGLANNTDVFTYLNRTSNNNIQFSLPNIPSGNVEWEFYLNGIKYNILFGGQTATINLSNFIDPSTGNPVILNSTNRAPMYCVNTLEVYVRQGSGCCYSAYTKEDAYDPICEMIRGGEQTKAPLVSELITNEKTGLQVYPNPATNYINVVTNGLLEKANNNFQVFNVDGKVVKTGKLIGTNTQININDLAKGVYYIKTTIGNSKFIKQ